MKHVFNHCIGFILTMSLLLASSIVFAKVTATVDRQYAYEGETVTLSVRAENSPNAQEPDFSPLLKDFQIGGTSRSSSISIPKAPRRSAELTMSSCCSG